MKHLRLVLWLLVAVVAGGSLYAYLNTSGGNGSQQAEVRLGGPFELINHRGEPITNEALANRVHAIFFGFTNCPDICPTTLYETAGWLKALDQDAEKIDFYFFTVDPERDTPEVLNDYVNAFDPRITAVTGNPDEIKKAVASYKAYAQKVELGDGDYTMDHSAFVMLFNSNGAFKGTIAYGEKNETALAKLRRLIENG